MTSHLGQESPHWPSLNFPHYCSKLQTFAPSQEVKTQSCTPFPQNPACPQRKSCSGYRRVDVSSLPHWRPAFQQDSETTFLDPKWWHMHQRPWPTREGKGAWRQVALCWELPLYLQLYLGPQMLPLNSVVLRRCPELMGLNLHSPNISFILSFSYS